MALENLISISFTNEELQQLDGHLSAIESLYEGKCITLTPEQRQEYGRLGNRNANWVSKVVNYNATQPRFTPDYLDKIELDKDFVAYQQLDPRFKQLMAIHDMMDDTLLILGFDLFQSSHMYYKHIRLLAQQNVPGAKAIYDDLSAQFPGRSVKKANETKAE